MESELFAQVLARSTAIERNVLSLADDKEESLRFALSVAIFDNLFAHGFIENAIAICETVIEDPVLSLGMRNEVFRYTDQYCYQDKNGSDSTLAVILSGQLDIQVGRLQDLLSSPAEDAEKAQVLEHEWTGTALMLSSLAALLSQEASARLLELSQIQETIPSVIKALGLAHQHFPRLKGGREHGTHIDKPAVKINIGIPNFKRDCITVISCLAHNHKIVQDQVREIGGIPLVLAQCQIDELNPYLREHATYCVRNLLEGNAENQEFVDKLKPIGVEQNAELRGMGYEAQLRNGTVGLAKIESINED